MMKVGLKMFSQKKIVIKGAGDLATGVAARLWRSGFPVVMTEIDRPLTVRRTVSLSDAVYEGNQERCSGDQEGSVTSEGLMPIHIFSPQLIKFDTHCPADFFLTHKPAKRNSVMPRST
jgi:hypothetical protein